MANVLPPTYRTALARTYMLRLLVVGAFVIALACAISIASLAPAYIASRTILAEVEQYRSLQEETSEAEQRKNAVVVARMVRTQVDALNTAAPRYALPVIEEVLRDWELYGEAIAITSIAYDRVSREVRFSGEASTREALSNFVATLRANTAFREVSLPVSDLVSAEEITFSIVATDVR